jgi:pimeloyl-ACP methyl ester carboxylesterase
MRRRELHAVGEGPVRRWRIQSGTVWLAGADTGAGEPVVLLHGLASTHRWWDLVVPRLPGFRVVRFDLRGHGCSSAAPDGYDIEHLAADVLAVLDGLGIGRTVLAGHSLGAAVAVRVAAAVPHRVAALACVEGGLYDPLLLFGPTWEQARIAMIRPSRGRITAAVLEAWLASTTLPAAALPAVLANYTEAGPGGALRLRLAPEAAEQLARDLWRQDPWPLLDAVRVPVLLVAARQGDAGQDRPRRESVRRARALLGARLSVDWVAGGHELPIERPERVARALATLVSRVPEAA